MFQPPSAAPAFPTYRPTKLVLPGDYTTSCYKMQELLHFQMYIHITQLLLESKHLHLFSKPAQGVVLSKALGWHVKRDYFPETTQGKASKFVTKIDLKSASSLVSSSMQTESTIYDRDGSSSFHFCHTCLFDIQSTEKGNCRTGGLDYTY